MSIKVENTSNNTQYPLQVPLPKGFQLFKNVGPGLVLAMSFLGTGDLVSSSVSGANYGYLLLWTLVISLIARVFIISFLAKYTLMNRYGDTQILEGFGRVAMWLPTVMAFVVIFSGAITQATFLRATAEGLYYLTGASWGGQWGDFICAVLVCLFTIWTFYTGKQYRWLEWIARTASVLMIIGYIIAIISIGGFDVAGFFRGIFTFQVPKAQSGGFAPIVVAVATIGTIAGNMPNLLYSGFMKDKGWIGPKYRKTQQFDLISGMLPLLIINMLFWIVGAEYSAIHPGFSIKDEFDMSHMMADLLGGMGPMILWLCIFGAGITSFPSSARGFSQLAANGFHLSKTHHKYKGNDEADPLFKKIQIIVFTIVPIFASLPHAPGLVALNIVGTSISTLFSLPIICIVLFMLTSSKKHMQPYAVNKPWQNVLLGVMIIIAFIVGFQTVMNLPSMFQSLFS